MICHAAIVSRQLGLPCVVGTETATKTVAEGQPVTVDGSAGAVYRGNLEIRRAEAAKRPADWADLWSAWAGATRGRTDLVPILPTLEALVAMPRPIATVVLVPDLDLRADGLGRWNDLEGLGRPARASVFDDYLGRVSEAAARQSIERLYLLPLGSLPVSELDEALERADDPRLRRHAADPEAPPAVLDPGARWPTDRAAVPLGSAAVHPRARAGRSRPSLAAWPRRSRRASTRSSSSATNRGSSERACPTRRPARAGGTSFRITLISTRNTKLRRIEASSRGWRCGRSW